MRLTNWREITHELTDEKKSQRVPLNIRIVEEDMRPLFNETTEPKSWDDILFIIVATSPFTILILWGLYEIFFNWSN